MELKEQLKYKTNMSTRNVLKKNCDTDKYLARTAVKIYPRIIPSGTHSSN